MPSKTGSRIGLWDRIYERKDYDRAVYADPRTAELAGEWLNVPSISVVEDWGCGYGGFKNYLGAHQSYVGIDGSHSRFADKIEDLTSYRSTVDAIHLRHVLEHNPAWRDILDNFLGSFTKRGVLTLFTPLGATERTIARYPDFNGTGVEMVDITLPEKELYERFARPGGIAVKSAKKLKTKSQYRIEHLFLLERQG